MSERFGATPEQWREYSSVLGLTADLLPVVSNPHATISPGSNMKSLGKTPSIYNANRQVAGIPKWTEKLATQAEVDRWATEPDYGICLQTRRYGAIDIDVPEPRRAQAIVEAMASSLDRFSPVRYRADSGKMLVPFKRSFAMPKRVIPVEGGLIEFLGDGQQFIAEGLHPDGQRYLWDASIVEAPELTEDQLNALWLDLISEFATGTPRIARQKRLGKADTALIVHDPVVDWLVENWENYDVGNDGQLFIRCPFEEEHTSDSGPTSTAYFPAGTGGYSQGHYVCLHAHCAGRPDSEFADATGYNLAQFEDLGASDPPAAVDNRDLGRAASNEKQPDENNSLPLQAHAVDSASISATEELTVAEKCGLPPWPKLIRDKAGKIEPTADNLVKCIGCADMVKRQIAWDDFKAEIVWAPDDQEQPQWRSFTDADTTELRIELERRGAKPMGKELLRDAIHAVAIRNRVDVAQEWLGRLSWDGVPRVETFAIDCWGWPDNAYSRAVSRYVWTALAGRIMRPGIRADMAPILVGDQGLKKTSALQLMVPSEDFYVEIDLGERDDNLSRRLRGKLIGELEELRGLNSRAIEEIKAFITRRFESWVPKFKEFESRFQRRLIMFGTGNDDEILNDPTGERRWLPGRCAFIDLERIIATRDQLWAEGAWRFDMFGLEWQDAERLAPVEHRKFKITDTWENAIERWLADTGVDGKTPLDKGYIMVGEVLAGALGVTPAVQNRGHEIRVKKALRQLGFVKGSIETAGRHWEVFERVSAD